MNDFSHDNTTSHTGGSRCERGQELITYLYGEEGVAPDFTRHLAACATCAEDAAAFHHVRSEVAALRESAPELQESFASLPYASLSFSNTEVDSRARSREIVALQRPSRSWHQARMALAEFFRVSPRWLQAGGAAAALAMCALISFGIVRTAAPVSQPATASTPGVERPAASQTLAITQADLDEYVEREIARRANETPREQVATTPTTMPETVASDTSAATRRPAQRQTQTVQVRAGVRQRRLAPAPARQRTPQPSADDLAADDDLPRLSDLLYGTD